MVSLPRRTSPVELPPINLDGGVVGMDFSTAADNGHTAQIELRLEINSFPPPNFAMIVQYYKRNISTIKITRTPEITLKNYKD